MKIRKKPTLRDGELYFIISCVDERPPYIKTGYIGMYDEYANQFDITLMHQRNNNYLSIDDNTIWFDLDDLMEALV